ncbi:MAG: zeta toxin family protein [Propionibacteriaceae bacterium]|nr:zeta toxin family protein [Propionibacteriaceae bacterium]
MGGQPGAGKTAVVEASGRAHRGSVIINGDDLRRFHPAYERTMATDPLAMPDVTAQAIGEWGVMGSRWLREQRISAVVESTLRQKEFLLGELAAYRDAGYGTELRVVAVPLELSRLGTLARYVGQAQELGAGRAVTAQGHDDRAALVPATVEALVASGQLDRLVIQDRDGRIFLDMDVSRGGPELAALAREVVDQARGVSSMTPQQAQGWFRAAVATLTALKDVPVDQDLLRVSARLATHDAAAVAAQAWPTEPEKQRSQIDTLQRHHRVAVRVVHPAKQPTPSSRARRGLGSRPDRGRGGVGR